MKRREAGFAIIEVIIATALMGIIMPVMTMTTASLVTNNQTANDHNIILHEVQNAGYWISRDVQMAKNVVFDDPSGFPLTLVIPVDTDENNDYSVDYVFEGNKLKRQAYDSSQALISEVLIADYINTEDTTFVIRDFNAYELTVKASRGEAVLEISYQVSRVLGSG